MSAFKKFSPDSGNAAISQRTCSSTLPSGCKFNASGLPVTACGIPSLDSLLADGIPIGSIVGIREDSPTNYWQIIGKSFLSQGLHTGQNILFPLVDADATKTSFLHQLPGVHSENENEFTTSNVEKNLNIAWRYEHLPRIDQRLESAKESLNFDLTKTIGKDLVMEGQNAILLSFANPNELLEQIQQLILANYNPKIAPSNGEPRKLLRIFLPSLGSLGWNFSQSKDPLPELTSFLCKLKAILRYAYAVCFVSFSEWVLDKRIFPFLDSIFSIDAAANAEGFGKSSLLLEYQGFVKFHKLLRIASFSSNSPMTTLDYVFKCKKRKFILEKYYLPPELSDAPSRTSCSSVSHSF